jgi:hypothetical protein
VPWHQRNRYQWFLTEKRELAHKFNCTDWSDMAKFDHATKTSSSPGYFSRYFSRGYLLGWDLDGRPTVPLWDRKEVQYRSALAHYKYMSVLTKWVGRVATTQWVTGALHSANVWFWTKVFGSKEKDMAKNEYVERQDADAGGWRISVLPNEEAIVSAKWFEESPYIQRIWQQGLWAGLISRQRWGLNAT